MRGGNMQILKGATDALLAFFALMRKQIAYGALAVRQRQVT